MDKEVLVVVDLDFVQGALRQTITIAGDLAAKDKLSVAGYLAADLFLALTAINVADASQIIRLQRRLPKLMDDLERVCVWPNVTDTQQSTLHSLVYERTSQVEKLVQEGISSFARNPPLLIRQYLNKLRQFSNHAVRAQKSPDSKPPPKVKAPEVEEYPGHVNATLYSTLQKHTLCSCRADHVSSERHDGRLRLRGDITKENDCTTFDVLYSASPNTCDYWQDLQLIVSMRESMKRVKYAHEPPAAIPNPQRSERYRTIPPGSFCGMIGAKLGSRIRCRVDNSKLHQLYRGSPIAQHAAPGPSISLGDILSTHRLSNRMKLSLAYIIASSFWQYYDSPWMNTRWSSDTIHFLPESRAGDHNIDIIEQAVCYAHKPYFVINLSDTDGTFAEYCDSFSVIHRYPRIIALAILLLEVGRGQSLHIEETGLIEADLNKNWELARRLVKTSKWWSEFDYPIYQEAIATILDEKVFGDCSIAGHNAVGVNKALRKAIIYDAVVAPLRNLIDLLGFSESIYSVGPMDATSQGPILSIPAPTPLRQSAQDEHMNKSAQWLDDLVQTSHHNIRQLSRQYLRERAVRPIRIAVLDTGYDDEAAFFQIRSRRQRLKGWRDLVMGSQDPVDENGHGTHTVSLIMKVAPLADIFVARIAKDTSGLSGSVEHINNAIVWAVNDCEADIISMSFGFQDEIPSISDTISKAEYNRRRQVLFFAAASNSGANRKEMFPASHDSVISIRETNSNGLFSDTNPPVDLNGPISFGTLGRDVPSAWLHKISGELNKSGSSVATAVAAGIAAVVLQYANVGFSSPSYHMPNQVRRLWTRRGMLAMFAKLSQNMGNRCFFISPSRFFSERDNEGVWTAMREACT
ncbi:hypothetical protein V8C37DRAFT_385885 [Trichoderma ceciliae]